jgi:hypothetical protein
MIAVPQLAGCGSETPPYGDLPIRDALSATPEVLATLPESARRDLANRMLDEQVVVDDDVTAASASVPSVAAIVQSADASREAEGKDAVVLGAVEQGSGGFAVHALAMDEAGEAPPELIAIEGDAEASTKALEDAALQGRAGAILARMVERWGAKRVVRVTGWPAGAVAANETIYVNGAWLVALSALDEKAEAPQKIAPRVAPWPALAPQSIDISPYNLPNSVDQCADDVRSTCACAQNNQCSHEPADKNFPDGNTECAWVNADPLNAEALCVLALMSVTEVAACIDAAYPSCNQTPVLQRDQARAFVADEVCMQYLQSCLNGKDPNDVPTSSGSSGSNCSSCDGPDCDSDCGSCNTCNNSNNCDGADCDSPDCNAGDCKGFDCKGCSMASGRRRPKPPGGTPLAPILIFASFMYVYNRVRRLS